MVDPNGGDVIYEKIDCVALNHFPAPEEHELVGWVELDLHPRLAEGRHFHRDGEAVYVVESYHA